MFPYIKNYNRNDALVHFPHSVLILLFSKLVISWYIRLAVTFFSQKWNWTECFRFFLVG